MTNILITGGSGFIGNHLINQLLTVNPKTKIYNIDLSESNNMIATHISCDINDEEKLLKLDLPQMDTCIHLAALCKEPGFEWDEYFQTNHIGTCNVLKLCSRLGVKNIIFTSTMMVYKAEDIRRNEDSITAPDTAYGGSKLLAEKELLIWKERYSDRSIKIIRPAVVFGKRENGNFTRLYHTLKRGFFPFIGKSSTVKSNIYVHELNSFICFLLKNSTNNTIYNMAFPKQYSIKDIVSTFKEVFNLNTKTITLPYHLMLLAAYGFELLNLIGLKNSIHHRRIQKLYFSTNVEPKNAELDGYDFRFDLKSALQHWNESCGDDSLH